MKSEQENIQLVIMYHRIVNETGVYSIAPDRFCKQLEMFQQNKSLKVIPYHELIAGSEGILISFDDGTEDNYDAAAILEKYNLRGTFFITGNRINQKGFLSTSQIQDMYRRGHSIGTHTFTEYFGLDRADPNTAFLEWKKGREAIEDVIGAPVNFGSVPGGYYTKKIVKPAYDAGIEHLFTSEPNLKRWKIGNCWVYGRFTAYSYRSDESLKKLAELSKSEIFKDKLIWNAKKIAKKTLRKLYLSVYDRYVHLKKSE